MKRAARRALLAVIVAVTLGGILVTAIPAGRAALHRLDSAWLGERVMDTMARVRGGEDWSRAEPLRPGQDYGWLDEAGAPVRIGHALGESGTPTANTLAALRRAQAAGLRLVEVDLVAEGGELRCQHDPGPQGNLVKDGCTFDTLLAALPDDGRVVLDIKTDFAAVGQRIVDRVRGRPEARRVIFQLYRPEDFVLFSRWQREADLPGPILTTYLAHRRIDHVAAQLPRLGVRVLTVSLDRLPALGTVPDDVAVLVHPVHDCVAQARAAPRARGFYNTLSVLRCGAASSSPSP